MIRLVSFFVLFSMTSMNLQASHDLFTDGDCYFLIKSESEGKVNVRYFPYPSCNVAYLNSRIAPYVCERNEEELISTCRSNQDIMRYNGNRVDTAADVVQIEYGYSDTFYLKYGFILMGVLLPYKDEPVRLFYKTLEHPENHFDIEIIAENFDPDLEPNQRCIQAELDAIKSAKKKCGHFFHNCSQVISQQTFPRSRGGCEAQVIVRGKDLIQKVPAVL